VDALAALVIQLTGLAVGGLLIPFTLTVDAWKRDTAVGKLIVAILFIDIAT